MLAAAGRRHRAHPLRLRAPRQRGDAHVQILVHGTDANRARIIQGYARAPSASGPRARPPRASRAPAARSASQSRLWFNEANDSHYFLVPGLIVLVMTLIGALLPRW